MKTVKRGLTCIGMIATLLLGTPACGRLEQLADPSVTAPAGETMPALDVDQKAAALLPDSVASRGLLRVAIPTNEPPTQFYKSGTRYMTGVNPDIARLIGKALGLDVEIKVVNFDSIIPGMAAGRYDMTVSSMTPTDKRIAVIDFVDYLQVGNAIVVAKGAPPLTQDTLCGKRVGVLIGSYQLTTNIPDYDEKCVASGRPPIQTSQFQDTRQAISALTSARLDAVLADSPILEYAATQNPDVVIAEKYDFTPVAVGVTKEPPLVNAVAAALDTVITSDAYREVLDEVRIGNLDDHPGPRQRGSIRRPTMPQLMSEAAPAPPPSDTPPEESIPVRPASASGQADRRDPAAPLRRCRGLGRRDQPPIRVGRRGVLSVRARNTARCATDRGVDCHLDDRRHSARHGSGDDAACPPTRSSAAISRALHLVLPGHPAAGAIDLLVQHRRPVPGHRRRASVRRPDFVIGSANMLITPLAAALLGLSLNEAAYMAEIIRGGIGSVDKGQYDAANALGMNDLQLMRKVVLPQAMRVVLPPTGNQVISMLKGTSLVSVLAISDLLYSAQIIYSRNYRTIPLLIVASFWYLLMTRS